MVAWWFVSKASSKPYVQLDSRLDKSSITWQSIELILNVQAVIIITSVLGHM